MNFSAILKFINICIMVFFFKKMKEYKKVIVVKEEEEEEEKDVDTWYTIPNGESRYKGEWKDGLPHGKGTKEIFEGKHKDADGHPCNAKGKLCSWSIIECTFVDGLANGYGKQIYKQDGEKTQPYYEGEFRNGTQHGHGAYYYGNRSYYKGNFKDSKFHGVGYHYYAKKKQTWVGEFYNDDLTEKGMWIDGELYDNKEKTVYKQDEEDEKRDINTWYALTDKNARYKGEWKNGLPNGKGIKHIYESDSYIDGNFVDGFAEGYGKQTFKQTWEKMVPYYEGEFERNNYQGKGEYHYGDGDYYKGEWKANKYHGQGAAYSQRLNRTWVGEYDNDKKVNGNWVQGEI